METTLAVLMTRRGRREAHRQWPDEVKARIVSESLRPGVKVNEVAERRGIKASRSRPVGFTDDTTPGFTILERTCSDQPNRLTDAARFGAAREPVIEAIR